MRFRFAAAAISAIIILFPACTQKELIPGTETGDRVVAVTGISVSPTSHTMYVGETVQLSASVLPDNASNKNVSWTSLSPSVASVDDKGLVTANKEGNATIRIITEDGNFKTECKIRVILPVDPTVHVTDLRLDIHSHNLDVGETLTLTATIYPDNADDKLVTWISSDPSVVTIGDGVVTAVAPGDARITATAHDPGAPERAFDICDIHVNTPITPPGPTPEGRWTDSGADVPAYPTYKTVSSKNDFPLVEITTDSGKQPASKDYYEGGTVRFSDPKGMYKGDNDTDYSTDSGTLKMQIRGRGNSTWEGQNGQKNPYRIKLDDHTKVFGMKGDKDWILLSDRLDQSLIRTAIALRISRLVSMPWTPKYRMVRMTMNGNDKGLYYLVEQKEVDRENKVPVTIQPGVVDSGYYLELDNKSDQDPYFDTDVFSKRIKFKDPDPNDEDASQRMTSAQKQYIRDYVNSVERAMESKDWETVHSLIEMDSWIQNYLVHEVTMNKDGNMRLSTYFAKDYDTKLFIPMVWDFDRSLGQDSYQKTEFNLPEWWPYGWFIRIRGGYPGSEGPSSYQWYNTNGRRPSYYQYLFEDPAFVARLQELWELYKPRLDMIPEFIDKMLEYNNVMYSSTNKNQIRSIRSNYITRIQWLDTNIKALKAQRYNPSTGKFEDL